MFWENDIQGLEIQIASLQNALASHNNTQLRIALQIACVYSSVLSDEVLALMKSNNPFISTYSAMNLPESALLCNVYAYLFVFRRCLARINPNAFSHKAVQDIFFAGKVFSPANIFYENKLGILTVRNLLDVLKYFEKVIRRVCATNTTRYRRALLVLESIQTALTNNPASCPSIDDFQLTLGILFEIMGSQSKTPEEKNDYENLADLVDLVIDFFIHS